MGFLYRKKEKEIKKYILYKTRFGKGKDMSIYKKEDWLTKAHSIRVAALCKKEAQILGLNEELAYEIGLNHDVGKIYVPQSILNKKEKLTELEKELIDKHAYYGYKALKEAGYKRDIYIPVLFHHGEENAKSTILEIPTKEEQQYINILIIADIFDALTSKRPYKEKMSQEEALVIMRNEKRIDQTILNRMVCEYQTIHQIIQYA